MEKSTEPTMGTLIEPTSFWESTIKKTEKGWWLFGSISLASICYVGATSWWLITLLSNSNFPLVIAFSAFLVLTGIFITFITT